MRAPLKIGLRRLFADAQIPIGKFFGGEANASTVVVPGLDCAPAQEESAVALKSFCIVLFARLLKIHPIE